MTAAKYAVELYINLNVMLVFALLVWLGLRAIFARTPLKQGPSIQLGALKALVLMAALSPLLAWLATLAHKAVFPGQSLVLSDLVVAAYLRGDIAMEAVQFESMLNTRSAWTDGLLALDAPVFALLAGVLAMGIAVCVARFVRSVWAVHRMLAKSYLWKSIGPVDIRISDRIAVPLAARGLFRRHVLLPTDIVARGEDLRIALAHELQHFRNHDIEWEFAIEMLRPVFFWNPAFVILKRFFDRLRELSCDEAVLMRRRFEAREYALCLLRFCERAVGGRRPRSLGVALVSANRGSARQELAARVIALQSIGQKSPLGLSHVAVFALVCGLSFSIFGASIQTQKGWSHDRLMLSTVVNLERLEAINSGL